MRVTQSRMGGGKVRKPSIKSDTARKKLLNPYDLPFNPFDDVPIQKLRQEESRQKQMKKSKTTLVSFWSRKKVQQMNRYPSSPIQESIAPGEAETTKNNSMFQSPVSRTTEEETQFDDLSWEVSPITLGSLLEDLSPGAPGDSSLPLEEGFEIQSPISGGSVNLANTTVYNVSNFASNSLSLPTLADTGPIKQQVFAQSSHRGRWAVRAEPLTISEDDGERWVVHNEGDSASEGEDSYGSVQNQPSTRITEDVRSTLGKSFDPIDLSSCDYRLLLRRPADGVCVGLVEDAEEAYEEIIKSSRNIVTRGTYQLFGVDGAWFCG